MEDGESKSVRPIDVGIVWLLFSSTGTVFFHSVARVFSTFFVFFIRSGFRVHRFGPLSPESVSLADWLTSGISSSENWRRQSGRGLLRGSWLTAHWGPWESFFSKSRCLSPRRGPSLLERWRAFDWGSVLTVSLRPGLSGVLDPVAAGDTWLVGLDPWPFDKLFNFSSALWNEQKKYIWIFIYKVKLNLEQKNKTKTEHLGW